MRIQLWVTSILYNQRKEERYSVYTLRRRHDGIPIARCYKIPVLLEVENKKKVVAADDHLYGSDFNPHDNVAIAELM